MKSNFEVALAHVLRWEGGDVNDPHDPGGATRKGISLRFLRAIGMDINGDGFVNEQDVWALGDEQIHELYRERFWNRVHGDELPAGLDLVVFDCAVNQGVGRASRILQSAVGASVDGVIGKQTLALTWTAKNALTDFSAQRALHYSSLVTLLTRYGFGWFRRLFDVYGAALTLAKES